MNNELAVSFKFVIDSIIDRTVILKKLFVNTRSILYNDDDLECQFQDRKFICPYGGFFEENNGIFVKYLSNELHCNYRKSRLSESINDNWKLIVDSDEKQPIEYSIYYYDGILLVFASEVLILHVDGNNFKNYTPSDEYYIREDTYTTGNNLTLILDAFEIMYPPFIKKLKFNVEINSDLCHIRNIYTLYK